jgi:hypothetical protein
VVESPCRFTWQYIRVLRSHAIELAAAHCSPLHCRE